MNEQTQSYTIFSQSMEALVEDHCYHRFRYHTSQIKYSRLELGPERLYETYYT